MKFTDLLRVSVISIAGVAVACGAAAVAVVAGSDDQLLSIVGLAWWATATVAGLILGRQMKPSARIAELLVEARIATELPEVAPGRLLAARLWPLALVAVVSIAIATILPQVAVIATGYAILWALAWRRQAAAVTAIEERDGVSFYVDTTSPFKPIKVTRTTGWIREPVEEDLPVEQEEPIA